MGKIGLRATDLKAARAISHENVHPSLTRRGGRRVFQEYFRLKTMLEFLHHAIERQFPLIHVVAIPASG